MESGLRDEEEGGAPDGDGGGGSGGAAGGGPRRPADPSSERQVIRWERFLPSRSLRVLLVEHDDSTRHIVAALLRKCSYHVVAVPDGLKAWEVLKEKHYDFDLVLTEVAMPSLSGIGLLSKIMSTEECKNIPVIMMSSHDSISVVLKCMLKGAVDFLVKPIRKNELCNLWQHVWRRHCVCFLVGSSNSYTNASNNNAASNHISTIAGDTSKTGENSNQGSDGQGSDGKLEMEIEGDQKHRGPHLAEGGSTSREMEAKPEQLDNGTPIMANTLKLDDNVEAGGISFVEKYQEKNSSYHKSPYREEYQEGDPADRNSYCQNNAPDETLNDMIDFIESVANRKCNSSVPEKYALMKDALPETSASSDAKSTSEFGSSPHLELSLRRQQLNGCVDRDFKQKHILNHSNASAFSRYGDKKAHHSCKKPVSSAVCVRTIECVDKSQSHVSTHGSDNDKNISLLPKGMVLHQGNGGETTKYFQVTSESNREDAGLVSCPAGEDDHAGHSSKGENMVFNHPQFGFIPLPIPVGAIPYQSLCAGYGAVLQQVFYHEASLQPHSSAAAEKATVQITSDQSGHHDDHLINHPQCNEFHHHEEIHQSHYRRQHPDLEPGDSRDLSCTPVELTDQSANCSQDILKGCGSNYSGETADAAANTGTALESGTESGAQNCSGKGLDSYQSSREAALIKFRMKRKDRCFEKKVRYHSRKKLAEQRPRVKGQFVRQKAPDSITTTEAED
ncbi:two-component response regulator-like APRR9 isoform X2 [Elaeis guineensis]|uniref:two-component response regulator-like APRR9 isoform X2 n=1 Tax=Elaeis guineensis var. tenera TaxID=51953 RepID=UPI003C6D2A1E